MLSLNVNQKLSEVLTKRSKSITVGLDEEEPDGVPIIFGTVGSYTDECSVNAIVFAVCCGMGDNFDKLLIAKGFEGGDADVIGGTKVIGDADNNGCDDSDSDCATNGDEIGSDNDVAEGDDVEGCNSDDGFAITPIVEETAEITIFIIYLLITNVVRQSDVHYISFNH